MVKWIIDLNARDGYIKYISTDKNIIFKMTKFNGHWKIFIYDFDIEFEYFGNHEEKLITSEVLRRINGI